MAARIRIHRHLPVTVAVGLVLAQSALTRSAAAQDGDRGDLKRATLEEVIVTARIRNEDLQDVPVSVQVVDGAMLAQQNHNTLEELTETVPSVHVQTGNYSNFVIVRGIGSGENPAFEQSVSMFVDNIYHGRSRMGEATFLDLERIEILKGPQSTFFGNNAIAGALNIVSKKPGSSFEAWTRALVGDFEQYALEGAIGGPITDTFGARVAVTRNGMSEGWIKNENLGEYAPRINNMAGRLTLAFNPNEAWDVMMKVEAGDHKLSGSADAYPLQWNNCPPPAPLPPNYDRACAQALALGVPIGLDNDRNSSLPGQGKTLSTFEDVLTVNYSNWGHVFTSVSGYYKYDFERNIDSDQVPLYSATGAFREDFHQWSQEFRVASAGDGPIEYLAGVYFQTDELDFDVSANAPRLNFIGTAIPAFAPYLPIAQHTAFLQDSRVYSVFGSVGWRVMDRLKLTAGLRGSWVKKDFVGNRQYGTGTQMYGGFVPLPAQLLPVANAIFGGGTGQDLTQRDDDWMPSAGIQYDLNPRAMVYLSFSNGFKAGGFNGIEPFAAPANLEYGAEHVDAYEVGIKSNWFDDRLRVNLGVFRSDYRGLQVLAGTFRPQTQTWTFEVRNAAESRSQGVELETEWIVRQGFHVLANVTYLDAYYESYPNASRSNLQNYCATPGVYAVTPACGVFPFPVPNTRDLSGMPTSFAPEWSASVAARYTLPIADKYDLTAAVSPYYTSSYNNTDDVIPGYDSYVRLDARLTLEGTDGHWAVDLIGKNLTDRTIASGAIITGKQAPRNVAVQFRYQW